MKNPILIMVIVSLVAVLGIGAYVVAQKSNSADSMMSKDQTMIPIEATSLEPPMAMDDKDDSFMVDDKMMNATMADSRYIQYSKTNLDKASSNRRVLFFFASWCPTCQPADANFAQNVGKFPNDLTLIRVNYNDSDTDQEEKDLAKKYGITYQHTFVQIDNEGNEVFKWNGGQIEELLSNIK